ncbi:DUF4340 domain-containing protein [Pseudomonas tohonis]|uniref:DUF4340 domain-containing protein n=1 Tax=Pseudomonas tohonis TaxID=2725477 RepID=UPI001F308F15|nr:DUF4340 domain-containing protein [Pseudomonas tohonis]
MGRKALLFLALVAVALVLVYVGLHRTPEPLAAKGPSPLLPALQGRLAEVERIEVQRPGQPVLRLARQEGVWRLPDKAGYPAAAKPVADLLRALGEAREVEARTARAELHGQLGLADKGEGQGIRVTLQGEHLPEQVVLVGKPGQQGKGQLVRLADQAQSWLVDRRILMPETELGWLDRRITRIPFDSVRQVEVTTRQGKALTVHRDAAGEPNLKVRQLPAGRKLAYEAAANGMATLFASLDFADAAPLDQVQFKDRPLLQFSLQSFAGGQLEGVILAQGEQYWMQLKRKEKFDGEQVAGRLDWAYRIEAFQYQALAKTLDDLISAK